ncbi:MAG: PAS domain S-box protein [Candidatus Cloacimonetes bacterium]|nr:PAS domain S-box protein [Candidatus Cloacimonadota bacterium]
MITNRETTRTESLPQIVIHLIMLFLIVITVMNSLKPHIFWEHFEYVDYPLHSTMEAIGALAAILMGFMSIRLLTGEISYRFEILSLGFLAMGSWDLFHSFLIPGNGFVLMHSLALLGGGFFFVLVIFNWSEALDRYKSVVKTILLLLLFILGVLLVINRDKLPEMAYDHQFSVSAKALNLAAGLLFLIAAIRLYFDYRQNKSTGILLLTMLALLNGFAGLAFPFSHGWTDSWWFWHFLRLTSYVFILGFMLTQFSRLYRERSAALAAMMESEEKFSRLFAAEPDALFIADAATGTIIDVNMAAEKLMKKSKADLIGINQMELHPADKREEIAATFREIAVNKSQKPQVIVVQDALGNIIPVEVVGNVIEIGNKAVAIGIFRDVSERVKLENERRKTEQKFSRFIELVPIPLCNVDQKTGEIKYFNKRFNELFGYTPEDLPDLTNWWEKAYPDAEYRKKVQENWGQAVERANRENVEIAADGYQVTCKDGGERTIIIGGVVIEDEFLATFIDITDLRDAEKVMKEQQEQMTRMFNGLDDVIYVSDPDTYELLYINDAFQKIFGSDYAGKKCYEVLQGRESPCPFCTNDIIINQQPGQSYTWEFFNEKIRRWYRCFDKAIRWSSGKMVRFEMAIDITEMKETELAIIDEKAIYESTIDSLPGIFYQIDTGSRFVKWNQRFKQVTGYSDDEMAQLNTLDLFIDEEKEKVAEAMQKVFTSGEAEVEASLNTKSRERIPYIFNGRLFNIKGNSFLIGMGTDVRQLKTIEQNLRKSNAELESFNRIAVGREKRMIELKQMINELSRSLGNEEPYDLSFVDIADDGSAK